MKRHINVAELEDLGICLPSLPLPNPLAVHATIAPLRGTIAPIPCAQRLRGVGLEGVCDRAALTGGPGKRV